MRMIEENKDGSKKILDIKMPFDKRNPDPNKDFGILPMSVRMAYLKNNRAVCFSFHLPFYLPHVVSMLLTKKDSHRHPETFNGYGVVITYHYGNSPRKESELEDCDILEGGKCYCDQSFSSYAEEWYNDFLRRENGFEWLWERLIQEWNDKIE